MCKENKCVFVKRTKSNNVKLKILIPEFRINNNYISLNPTSLRN